MSNTSRIVSTPREGLWIISKTLQSVARVDPETGEVIERIVVGTEWNTELHYILKHRITIYRVPLDVIHRMRELRKHPSFIRILRERENRLKNRGKKRTRKKY